MKIIAYALAGAALFGAVSTASAAPLKVFACVPEWASLVKTIGGERIASVTLATTAFENPDNLKPTPGMIAALGEADLLLCTGIGLEDEWLPALMERAKNPNVAKGKPGYFMAGEYAKVIEEHNEGEHSKVDARGAEEEEVHPHVQGDPNNVRVIAGQLAKRLIALDPEGKDVYTDRTKTFLSQLTALTKELKAKAAPLKGINIVVQHDHSTYLFNWLGVRTAAIVEPEPNVAPGPAHLAKIIADVPKNRMRFVIYAAYEDPAPSRFVSEKAKIPLIKLPFTVGGTPEATDLLEFYKDSVQRLLDGLAGRERT
ncbi:metal ABC transporter substrate-binding protein [Starkeya koreensis]|uniref:Metal ABC transporter substrate-binding protein n=1 Tax=Ancylobacter koreensis TaxID=266121 RepID=A0ABT0DQ68_9HYPH|nr:metal ABC transporter substrate-binding protein [Ancylobacter koreensis]MCK0209418.1 metal ABC transporter substrate-binding protein [Ancylobacter koreensis]